MSFILTNSHHPLPELLKCHPYASEADRGMEIKDAYQKADWGNKEQQGRILTEPFFSKLSIKYMSFTKLELPVIRSFQFQSKGLNDCSNIVSCPKNSMMLS